MRAAFFVGAGLCGLSFISVASATTVPPCTAAQLQIYEVAVDMPGMMKSAKDYYIDLLKSSLCGTTYEQPPVPIELFWAKRWWVQRGLSVSSTACSGLSA